MEERSVGTNSTEFVKKSCFLFLLFGCVSCLPTREERSQTLWRKDKVRDTRVDDVIKDIKQLVEAEYLTLMGEDGNGQKLEERKGEPAGAEDSPPPHKEGEKLPQTESVSEATTTESNSTPVPKTTATTLQTTTTAESTTKKRKAKTTTSSPEISEEAKEGEELCDTIPDLGLLRNGLGQTGFLWPEGKIPYVISGDFTENQTATIKASIKYYNDEFEGCIEWIEKTDESNYVTFDNSGSCSSRIGVAFFPFPVAQSIQLGRCAHLAGHVKHEMMHTIGFYHEHSRSDRDKFVEIKWSNIPLGYQAQFSTYRWTTGYGETYDYESIMHYSSRAFIKDYANKEMRSIVPRQKNIDPDNLGFKPELSPIDKIKIRKMYKCDPYNDYRVSCSSDDNCGLNEYCAPLLGECRTKLPRGSFCLQDRECLNACGGGLCADCIADDDCASENYCAYKYLPAIENECSSYCGSLCLISAQCGGDCSVCSWGFTCQKE